MRRLLSITTIGAMVGIFLLFFGNATANEKGQLSSDEMQVMQSLSSMPLAFTQNNGQWPDSILFRANAGGATMWFTPSGATDIPLAACAPLLNDADREAVGGLVDQLAHDAPQDQVLAVGDAAAANGERVEFSALHFVE